MNAKEVMQALLEGKVLVEKFNTRECREIRLKGGNLESREDGNGWKLHKTLPYMTFEKMEIRKEYPLTFVGAMLEVSKGHEVESEHSKTRIRADRDGSLIRSFEGMTGPIDVQILPKEITGMWRVVE